MKFKKHIACISALVLLSGGIGYFAGSHPSSTTLYSFANQFGDINGDGSINATDAALILQYAAYHGAGGSDSLEVWLRGGDTPTPTEATEPKPTEPSDGSLTDDDNMLTVLVWNQEQELYVEHYRDKYAPADMQIVYRDLNCTSSDAAEKIRSYVNSGADADLYFAEQDWIRKLTDDYKYALPLSELGITEADYADAYDYTIEIGKNKDGKLMAAAPEVYPGFYAYNADLAKQYLGVTTPEQMQAKISDWSKFEATAKELKSASGGKVTIADSINGVWTAYHNHANWQWVKGNNLVTDQAEAFLPMGKRLLSNGYVDPSMQQWTQEWMRDFDRTLGYFYASWTLQPGSGGSYAYGSGNWNIVEGPSDFFWGGYWICAAPHCDTKKTAADFLRTFTTDADRMQTYMAIQKDVNGDGHYLCNNRKAVQSFTGASGLLCGQDPYPILDAAAQGVSWDYTKATRYDWDISWRFCDILRRYYQESDSTILNNYKSEVKGCYSELS